MPDAGTPGAASPKGDRVTETGLELAAVAAYEAFAQSSDRPYASWAALPADVRACWRATADAVQMMLAARAAPAPDPASQPWRVGRHVGRTVYAMGGDGPSRDDDVLIGVMDTRELAAEAVAAHNARLTLAQAPGPG